ncbi:transposase [Snodgrassella sp. CFCC 13594]|uniref:transposase n=1 Tax=Snodgrassella sp. CFCC 13594 TaxID=1775559 RepID=UPI0008365A80|nr:transposase [Snodgrassella sp. CFCC 13594]
MKRNRYDESFKSEAVKLALSSEVSYTEMARDLGINYKTLCNWIKQTMTKPKPNNPKTSTEQSKTPSKQDYQALERHNRALQKELDLRKREIEFLKKASAYFASLKQ